MIAFEELLAVYKAARLETFGISKLNLNAEIKPLVRRNIALNVCALRGVIVITEGKLSVFRVTKIIP